MNIKYWVSMLFAVIAGACIGIGTNISTGTGVYFSIMAIIYCFNEE